MEPQLTSPLQRMVRKSRWLVFSALSLFVLIMGLLLLRQDFFRDTITLYFIAPNAQGLNQGMAVKLVGFKIGTVEEIVMQPDATVRVTTVVNQKYRPLIGVDARAKLLKEGLVGDSVVEIIPGQPDMPQVADGAVLRFERGTDIADLAENLMGQITPILSDVKQITAGINNPRGDVAQTIKNINLLSGQLRESVALLNGLLVNSNGKLDGVYGRVDGTFTRLDGTLVRVDRVLDKTHADLDQVGQVLQEINRALPKLVTRADSMMENIQGTAVDIKKIAGASAEQIPPLVRSTNALVQDSQEVLQGAKQSWPLRDMLPPPTQRSLPTDGYVAPLELRE